MSSNPASSSPCDVEAFVATMGTKVGPERWLECNPELWTGLLPGAAVEKVTSLGSEESWTKVKDEISTLIASSALGARLFGWCARELCIAELQSVIEKQVTKLLTLASVGNAEVAELMMESKKSLEKVKGLQELPEKREVTIMYRGWKAPRVVRSIHEELELNLVSAARGQAVAMGSLKPLPGERALCKGCKEGEIAVIKDSYVKHSLNAREYLENVTKSNECKSGEQLLDRLWVWGGSIKGGNMTFPQKKNCVSTSGTRRW